MALLERKHFINRSTICQTPLTAAVCQEQQFDNWDGLAGSVESSTCCQRGKEIFRHWLTYRNSTFSWNPRVHVLKFRAIFMFWNISMHPSSSNLLAGWRAACGELSTDFFLFVCLFLEHPVWESCFLNESPQGKGMSWLFSFSLKLDKVLTSLMHA